MFANCKYEELSYPKTQKECDPNPITSIENATTSSSTSLLASNKEIPPPPEKLHNYKDFNTHVVSWWGLPSKHDILLNANIYSCLQQRGTYDYIISNY